MTKGENKILAEVSQAVLGIKETEDKGIVGDIRDIKDLLQKQNGRIRRLEIAVVAISISLGGGIWGAIQLALGR